MAVSRLCSIADCGKRHAAHGYCQTHFKRWHRYGDPHAMRRATPNMDQSRTCTVPSCSKRSYAFGLCSAHYTRNYRHGDPAAGGTSIGAPLQWLRDHIDHQGAGCLTWPFASIAGGGVVTLEGKQTTAAAVMCLLVHGPKPTPKHEAAHNCGKAHEACVNPRHLRWATRSNNHMDKHLHGTMARGEQSPRHILTEKQVIQIRRREQPPVTMARLYGVCTGTIYAILRRRNWAWLD